MDVVDPSTGARIETCEEHTEGYVGAALDRTAGMFDEAPTKPNWRNLGLGASVWTENHERGERIGRRTEARIEEFVTRTSVWTQQ